MEVRKKISCRLEECERRPNSTWTSCSRARSRPRPMKDPVKRGLVHDDGAVSVRTLAAHPGTAQLCTPLDLFLAALPTVLVNGGVSSRPAGPGDKPSASCKLPAANRPAGSSSQLANGLAAGKTKSHKVTL